MAEPETHGTVTPVHDGRFGDQFDDEISNRGLMQGLIGIGVITALAIVAMIFLWQYFVRDLEASAPSLSPLIEEGIRQRPPAPLLQADPEAELIEMRRELAERMGNYGWVDEAAGVVHVPVDKAIDLVLERGLAPIGTPPAPEPVDTTTPTDAPIPEVDEGNNP